MADRYQDRTLNADGFGRGGDQHQRADNDPLAELARLIGQNNDPLGAGRGNPSPASPATRAAMPQNQFQVEEDQPAGGPPPWMQRANRKEIPRDQQKDFQIDEPEQSHFQALSNALNRYGAPPPPIEQGSRDAEQSFDADEHQPDPSRYDDALFGQVNTDAHEDFQHDNAFPDDPYAFHEEGYEDDEVEEEPEPKRRGGLLKVAAVLALAVVGTGAAFAYRTYIGSSRSGEPPIIKADNSPTKIVPTPQDGSSAKVPDRLVTGDGTEKLVSREETPVDVNSRSISGGGNGNGSPRVVFPQLNQNSNPPSPSSVAPSGLPPAGASNGTMANNEPRKIRTLSVRGDQSDATASTQAPASPPPAPSAAKQAAAAKAARNMPSPANANASANTPMSISPQSAQDAAPPAAEPRARVAATNPAQTTEPAAGAAASGGGYLVQISSQRNEADAQASFKALQTKFPAVLGSQTPVIKRADLGEKGIYYRAMVGPFGTSDEAAQFCNSLRSAGGQCLVPRNQ
jgi:sporulation related protein